MNSEKWVEHLSHWRTFLNARISSVDDKGEKEKYTRQLTAIERIRYSAVLNPKLLVEFVCPLASESSPEEIIDYFLELNESQQKAVSSVINGKRYLSLIQGPPGTGKTQVISEICLQLFKRNKNVRILVCSETHVAVNNLISRIVNQDSEIRCVRICDKEQNEEVDAFSPKAITSAYLEWLESVCSDQDLVKTIEESLPEETSRGLEKALALSANVAGMTCNRVGAYRFDNTTEMFDFAIIDEACKATLPEIIMPLAVAKRAVLVGDPKQLPPVFCSEDQEIIKSIENCDLQHYMYIDELFNQSDNAMLLDTQYRMENAIGSMISCLFYDGLLKNGRNVVKKDSLIWINYMPSKSWPEQNDANEERTIIRNMDECGIIKAFLYDVEKDTAERKKVAVIVPYKHQASELRKSISSFGKLEINIDTVDGFQGKEADIVLFGITRTTGSFRFLADYRRLNVALSRAREQVIIVGNLDYAKKHKLLERIANACQVISR